MDTYLSGAAAQEAFVAIQWSLANANNANGGSGDVSADRLDDIAQQVKDEHGGESDENFTYKAILPVYQSIMPGIYSHINYAINTHDQPDVLERTTSEQGDRNRGRAQRLWDGQKRPFGYSVDEYPFASKVEGGYGANTFLALDIEQDIQGFQIRALYVFIKVGDKYLVELESENSHPNPYGPAFYKYNNKDKTWEPSAKIIYAPEFFKKPVPKPEPVESPYPIAAIIALFAGALRFAF
jgi:hypothetical protein